MTGIIAGDFHTGALEGITPPEWHSDKYRFFQEPFWNWFTAEMKKLPRPDFLLLTGDMTHGEGKKERLGFVTQDTLEQAEMAIKVIDYINPKWMAMVYGTPYHTAGTYSYEDPIAAHFGASIEDTQLIRLGGKLIKMRHVVGRSDTPYGQGTQLYKEVTRDLLQMVEREGEEQQVDYHIRGHVHYHFLTKHLNKMAETCPCLELPGSVFGRRMRGQYYDVGFLKVEIDGHGDIITKPVTMPLKIVHRREILYVGQRDTDRVGTERARADQEVGGVAGHPEHWQDFSMDAGTRPYSGNVLAGEEPGRCGQSDWHFSVHLPSEISEAEI